MAETADHRHHGIDYVELAATDLDAMKRFYGAAFGWTFTDYAPEYIGFTIGSREVGGVRHEEEVRPGGPLVILYSDDLESTLSAVREAGGEIVQEPFSFPGGRRFHFADPAGNELAVWSQE